MPKDPVNIKDLVVGKAYYFSNTRKHAFGVFVGQEDIFYKFEPIVQGGYTTNEGYVEFVEDPQISFIEVDRDIDKIYQQLKKQLN